MEKERQEQLKVRLYNLTFMFVKAYKPKYYYQYQGDLEDLASDIYCEFLTPKASKGREKQTLLDKFDDSVTSIEYLTKVCVIRKLIDKSRQDPTIRVSLDRLIEGKGDSIAKALNLVDSTPAQSALASITKRRIKERYETLSDDEKNKVYSVAVQIESEMCTELKPCIPEIHGCLVQQITDKSALLYVKAWRTLITFDIKTGNARGSRVPFTLTDEELESLKNHRGFTSHMTKELFLDYMSKYV